MTAVEAGNSGRARTTARDASLPTAVQTACQLGESPSMQGTVNIPLTVSEISGPPVQLSLPPSRTRRATAFHLYQRLDSSVEAGIPIRAFRTLWTVCQGCDRVLCKDSTFFHVKCPPADWTAAVQPEPGGDAAASLFNALGSADRRGRSGLTKAEFFSLFRKCGCGKVTTKHHRHLHLCPASSSRTRGGDGRDENSRGRLPPRSGL